MGAGNPACLSGARIDKAALRCGGETVGKVRTAKGPERSGVSGCAFLNLKTASWACRDKACVRRGSEGSGVGLVISGGSDEEDDEEGAVASVFAGEGGGV